MKRLQAVKNRQANALAPLTNAPNLTVCGNFLQEVFVKQPAHQALESSARRYGIKLYRTWYCFGKRKPGWYAHKRATKKMDSPDTCLKLNPLHANWNQENRNRLLTLLTERRKVSLTHASLLGAHLGKSTSTSPTSFQPTGSESGGGNSDSKSGPASVAQKRAQS